MSDDNKTTYKAWFKIYRETKWVTAGMEWDTKEEATSHAVEKFINWTATEDWTVTRTGVDPNETKGEMIS